MASLQRVRVGRHTYGRVVESRRVDGEPRAVPVLQLGTAGALLDRLLRAPQRALRLRSSQHGDVAALEAVADRLDLVATVDRHVPKRNQAEVDQTRLGYVTSLVPNKPPFAGTAGVP